MPVRLQTEKNKMITGEKNVAFDIFCVKESPHSKVGVKKKNHVYVKKKLELGPMQDDLWL
jgi:hypothetical protein